MGRLRSDEYDGGVAIAGPLEVDGRCDDDDDDVEGDGGGLDDEACARRLDDDALSRGDGDALREREERSRSFSRFVRSNCSN